MLDILSCSFNKDNAMERHDARLDYPKDKYHLILQSSSNTNEFYGLDELERKKLKILLAKYGCRHCFHVLPDNVYLEMHPFSWNELSESFEIQSDGRVRTQLNTLEEAIIDYIPNEEYSEY